VTANKHAEKLNHRQKVKYKGIMKC